MEEVRRFARRRPGAFLAGSLVAGVVAGRLTRGAKAAQDSTESSAQTGAASPSGAGSPSGALAGASRRDPQSYVSDAAYDSPRVADVMSPVTREATRATPHRPAGRSA